MKPKRRRFVGFKSVIVGFLISASAPAVYIIAALKYGGSESGWMAVYPYMFLAGGLAVVGGILLIISLINLIMKNQRKTDVIRQ